MFKSIIQLLLLLAGPLVDAWKSHQRRRDQKRRQEARNEVDNDPGGSMVSHFIGMPNDLPRDASATDKAKTDNKSAS